MSRYITDIRSSKSENDIDTIIQRFVKIERFKLKKYKGGMAYKKGIGFLTAPRFMQIKRNGTAVHIEAWVKVMGERNFEGFLAFIPKKLLKAKINKLIAALN